ncbi:MAG: TolC family protein [Gammaproteobacteria bacterium]|nr:TolC family protein [Gammaproteobacteria bacterium]
MAQATLNKMAAKTYAMGDFMRYKRAGLLGSLLLLVSCSSVPTVEEMELERAKNVVEDLEKIRPADLLVFEQPLTLDEVLEIGLSNNLELRMADFEQQISDDVAVAAKLSMLPNLDANASSVDRTNLPASDAFNVDTGLVERQSTVAELRHTEKANLTLTWNVLDFMMSYTRSKQAEMERQATRLRRQRQAQNLALDLTDNYWKAAIAEDALDHVRRVEAELDQQKKQLQRESSNSNADKFAIKEAELRLLELELSIRQLQANLSKARLDLANLMGLNQSVKFSLARVDIQPIIADLPRPEELDIFQLEEYALKHRPELYEQDLKVHVQREEAYNALLRMFPGFSLFAGRHYDGNTLLRANYWGSVGANLSMDLFALPSRYMQMQGEEKAVELLKVQRLMMTAGVITQTHVALLDYAIKVDRFLLLEETYTLSSELLEMMRNKDRIQNGSRTSSSLPVTQKILEEMAAKLRRDEAVVELLAAHKRLFVSLGVDPSKWNLGFEALGITRLALDPSRDNSMDLEVMENQAVANVLSFDQEPSSGVSSMMNKYLWSVQVGAFKRTIGPARILTQVESLVDRLDPRDAVMSNTQQNGVTLRRVRFVGLSEPQSRSICDEWRSHDLECWSVRPGY